MPSSEEYLDIPIKWKKKLGQSNNGFDYQLGRNVGKWNHDFEYQVRIYLSKYCKQTGRSYN